LRSEGADESGDTRDQDFHEDREYTVPRQAAAADCV
jgi:hypothetical protein